MQLLSIFGGGLWFIPLGILGVLVYCIKRTLKVRKGGTTYRRKVNGVFQTWHTSDAPAWTSIFPFWCSVILLLAFILTLIAMIADK